MYDDKNIQFLSQDLVKITLKAVGSIGKTKGYHLILKIAIPGPESGFLLIAFINPHLVINTLLSSPVG